MNILLGRRVGGESMYPPHLPVGYAQVAVEGHPLGLSAAAWTLHRHT